MIKTDNAIARIDNMSEQDATENASSREGDTVRVISTSDNTTKAQGDGSPNSASRVSSVGNGEASELTELLEEVRRLKSKLTEVDERTQRDSMAVEQANLTLHKWMVGAEEISSGNPQEAPPPVPPNTDVMKENIFQRVLSTPGDFERLRQYTRFDRRRLEHRHLYERSMQSRFEMELNAYYGKVMAENKKPDPQESESTVKVDINRVGWLRWKSRTKLPESRSYVIDVLVEEPNLSYSHKNIDPAADTSFVEDEQTQNPKEYVVIGEEPLPERIRIRSQFLETMVRDIDSQGLNPPRYRTGESFVMVRPFKFLTFYRDAIQKWFDGLQENINSIANTPTRQTSDDRESILPETKDTDIQKEGQRSEELSHDPQTSALLDTKRSRAAHIRCLLDFMDSYISAKRVYLEQHAKRVSFPELWHLFKPGTEVVEAGDRHTQCYRVVKVTSPKHRVSDKYSWFFRSKGKTASSVSIYCVYVDFDGSLIGPVSRKFEITRYEGSKDVKSLPIYPLHCESDRLDLRRELIERGNKFLRVIRVGHMHYNGLTVDARDEIDSQVVIDFTEAFAAREGDRNNSWKPRVQVQARAEDQKLNEGNDSGSDSDSDSDAESCDGECCFAEDVLSDNYIDEKQNERYLSDLLDNTEEGLRPAPLEVLARPFQKGKEMYVSEDDLVIMSYRVFGFVLRSRSWAKLDVEELMEIDEYRRRREIENPTGETKSHNAFDNLVFPKDGLDRKKIVRSLVAQHFRDKESASSRDEQSDIVRGKGKGLIILLHGAPGVGKTSTAEGIAELFNKPLFQITCGDLGTTAREVETALETNFSLANKWGSILLLDEADVFLARRTPHDFQRNGLVAVFLRVLEYYAGILFLTTNRIGDFDEAFSSRIHISLHYPALDYNSSVDIFDLNWRLIKARFKNKGRDLEIDESKITASLTDYWHKHPNARWNGRQIRNACQTALALAEFEAQTSGDDGGVVNPNAKVHLGVSHMKTVSDAYLEFIKYLQDVRDADQERYAYLMGIRRNESTSMPPENPLAYGPSTPMHRGQVSRLAEHRAKSAARYNRPDQGLYPPSNSYANSPGDRPSHLYGSPMSGGVGSPYHQFPQQASGAGPGPYQPPPLEPQGQRGWNPGPMGGYYASQETQFQQGSSPGAEAFSNSQPYGQSTQ